MQKRIITIAVCGVALLIGVILVQRQVNLNRGHVARQALLKRLSSDAVVTLPDDPDPEPTPEFLSFLAIAVERATATYDQDRTKNRWVCACAFYVTIDHGADKATIDQHHLLIDGQYYHLAWHGNDLMTLMELWDPQEEMPPS